MQLVGFTALSVEIITNFSTLWNCARLAVLNVPLILFLIALLMNRIVFFLKSEYKKFVLESVHNGLVASLGIEDWDRFQRIIEYEKCDFETAPEKTDNFMIIELSLFPGRTKEQKKMAIEMITSNLVSSLSIKPTDVFIVINEPPLENWGMGGNQKQ